METPVRSDYENSLDLSLNLFPISREGQNFNLPNIHYLNLNQLQALEPVKHEKLQQWISLHLGLFFSESDNEIIAGNKLYSTESGIIRQSQRKYYNSLHQLGRLGQKIELTVSPWSGESKWRNWSLRMDFRQRNTARPSVSLAYDCCRCLCNSFVPTKLGQALPCVGEIHWH